MTDKQQRDSMRRHAAEEFLKSYQKQLLDSFQAEPEVSEEAASLPESEPEPAADDPPSGAISLSELEAAISDIDQFLQSQHPESPEGEESENR